MGAHHHHHEEHHHGKGACGHHHHAHGDGKLTIATALNLILTIAQIIGGIISGSLALIADALHNLSDVLSMIIALISKKIARRPADEKRSFGYKRAEIIAALLNLTTLAAIGLYLIAESVKRFLTPEIVDGSLVMWLAGVGLIVNGATSLLTLKEAKLSLNNHAVFLHNFSDFLASLAVCATGYAMQRWGLYWLDPALTLLIAAYVLIHAYTAFPHAVHILMDGSPKNISNAEIEKALSNVSGVLSVHHLHIWQLNEQENACEAHIVIKDGQLPRMEEIKSSTRQILLERFSIHHTTLEIEISGIQCAPCPINAVYS